MSTNKKGEWQIKKKKFLKREWKKKERKEDQKHIYIYIYKIKNVSKHMLWYRMMVKLLFKKN